MIDRIEWIAIGLIVAIVVFLGFVVWQAVKSEKITLNKSEWICTKTETQMYYMVVGKVSTPQITEHCVSYERR